MSKLLVVARDPVNGTDTHQVAGTDTSDPPVAYAGTGDYAYEGAVTGGLSDLVTIGGQPLAVVTSTSTLRAEGTADHTAPQGGDFKPPAPPPNPGTLQFLIPAGVGSGQPSPGAGSSLLTVGGARALLDGDPFDTCGIPGGRQSSTVTASNQSFVTCSG